MAADSCSAHCFVWQVHSIRKGRLSDLKPAPISVVATPMKQPKEQRDSSCDSKGSASSAAAENAPMTPVAETVYTNAAVAENQQCVPCDVALSMHAGALTRISIISAVQLSIQCGCSH